MLPRANFPQRTTFASWWLAPCWTHLELFGIIAFDGYYYSDIRFEAHQTGAQILAQYSEKTGRLSAETIRLRQESTQMDYTRYRTPPSNAPANHAMLFSVRSKVCRTNT